MVSSLDRRLFSQHIEDDETISRIVHKHWLVGLRDLLWPGTFVLLCLGALALRPNQITVYLLLIALAGFSIWLARNFFDYYLDAWIISDQGIIDLAWMGWFHRQSTRVLFSDIQGVSYEISGFLATILRFGTISVEKISTGTVVSLPYVKHPKQVDMLILRNMETYLHSKNLKNASHVQEVLSRFVAEQAQLKSVSPQKQ